jgi:hypothetical protein
METVQKSNDSGLYLVKLKQHENKYEQLHNEKF